MSFFFKDDMNGTLYRCLGKSQACMLINTTSSRYYLIQYELKINSCSFNSIKYIKKITIDFFRQPNKKHTNNF